MEGADRYAMTAKAQKIEGLFYCVGWTDVGLRNMQYRICPAKRRFADITP